MRVQFFEHAEVVNLEEVEAHLLRGPALDHIQYRFQQHQRQAHLPAGDPLDHLRKGAEGRVQHQRANLVGVQLGEHDCTETAHAPAPQHQLTHWPLPSHLLQQLPDVKDLVHPVGEDLGVGVTAAQHVEGHQIKIEIWNQLHQR